jgi:hypothetical protein
MSNGEGNNKNSDFMKVTISILEIPLLSGAP